MTTPPTDDQLRRYLLGALSEADESRLEDAYLGDPALVARLDDAEHDLVDDYVTGALTGDDRTRFERHYLTTPEHHQQVAVARALRDAASKTSVAAPSAPRASVPRWVLPLAAVVVLALAALLLTRVRTTPPPVEVAQQPSPTAPSTPAPAPPVTTPEAPPPAPPIVLATVLLQSGLTRGASDLASVRLPPATTHVDVQFPADAVVAGASARIETPEGAVVFSGPVDAAPVPHVRVPAASLPAGDYLVVVVPARRDPAIDAPEYSLRVR